MYPCRYWWLSPSVNVEPDRSYIVLSFAKIEGKFLPSTIAIELMISRRYYGRQAKAPTLSQTVLPNHQEEVCCQDSYQVKPSPLFVGGRGTMSIRRQTNSLYTANRS